MALVKTTISGITNASFNSLVNSLTAVGQSSAITVGTTGNTTDHLVTVAVAVGAITPSATTQVNILAYASIDGTTWPGGSATSENGVGSDAALTLNAFGNNAVFLGVIPCHTASITHKSKAFSIAAAFAGSLPAKYVIVVQNQSGVALAASGHTVAAVETSYT